jgi:hypothetical protein
MAFRAMALTEGHVSLDFHLLLDVGLFIPVLTAFLLLFFEAGSHNAAQTGLDRPASAS